MLYPGHLLGRSNPSAEMQLVYSTVPADWAIKTVFYIYIYIYIYIYMCVCVCVCVCGYIIKQDIQGILINKLMFKILFFS